MILNDDEIDEQIRLLEERKTKLMKLKVVAEEVCALEASVVKGSTDFKLQLIKIEEVVIAHFHLSIVDIRSRSRSEHIVKPRQIIFYIARRITHAAAQLIGAIYGRGHDTVLYGCQSITEDMSVNPEFKNLVEILEAACCEKLQTPVTNENPQSQDCLPPYAQDTSNT